MYRFLIRPIWLLLHVTVVATVLLMVNLAFWQIGRYHEKVDFNATVKQRITEPIVPVEKLLSAINDGSQSPKTVEWRTVLVVGEYIGSETVEAVNRAQDGGATAASSVDRCRADQPHRERLACARAA
jgi:cytochrome oxidase assembly protein ShyY1